MMAKKKNDLNKKHESGRSVLTFLSITMLIMIICAPFKPLYFVSAIFIFGLMLLISFYLKEVTDRILKGVE